MDWISEWDRAHSGFSADPDHHIRRTVSTGASVSVPLSTSGIWALIATVPMFVAGVTPTSTTVSSAVGGFLAASERAQVHIDLGKTGFVALRAVSTTGTAYLDRVRQP
jgi:hypothetical protein